MQVSFKDIRKKVGDDAYIKNPRVKENEILIAEVIESESMLGSYIISYKIFDKYV